MPQDLSKCRVIVSYMCKWNNLKTEGTLIKQFFLLVLASFSQVYHYFVWSVEWYFSLLLLFHCHVRENILLALIQDFEMLNSFINDFVPFFAAATFLQAKVVDTLGLDPDQ